jgi:hypothetical protein
MLEKTYENGPSSDTEIVLDNFNAKVGDEENARATFGKHSLHKESHENGRKLINYVTPLNMVVGCTIFSHRNIHKMAWRSPEGNTMNQIGHVLIGFKHCNNLLDVRSYRGANVISDRYLIIAEIRSRINTNCNKQ